MDRPNRSKDDISSKPLDTREIIYTSLLLLGFVPREMEEKYNILFTRDMFSLPNKRGFEVVMHFLFERLNPTLSQERFRHCWPIFDKKQEQTFRKTISNWLTEISKDDEDANLPRIVPSLFMSPGGDRFYTLLFYFCHYVMVKTCKKEHGVKNRDLLQHCIITASTKQYAPVMAQTIQASTVIPRKKFLQVTQEMVYLQRQWKEYASVLVKEHRSLCKKIREIGHAIKEEECKMIENTGSSVSPGIELRVRTTGMTDGEWDVLAVKRAQRIQKVRDLWQSVKVCNQEQADERAVIDSITSERTKKDRLDAADLPIQVPEILLRECEQEIQRRRIKNIYEGGKLDLVSLIKLWNLSLRLYLETLNEAPLPDFEEMMPSAVTQVHTHNAHLANARALRNSLAEEVLPDLQRSVSQLLKYREDGVELPTRDTLVAASPRHFLGKGVELLPPTPPVSFDPMSSDHVSSSKSYHTQLRKASSILHKSPKHVGTPEIMTQLRESVNKTAMKKAGLAQGTPSSTLREVRIPTQREQKIPAPTNTKDFARQRYKTATSASDREVGMHETPLSGKPKGTRKNDTFRHPSSKRMVQTAVKKKPPSFNRPSATVRKKHTVSRVHINRDVGLKYAMETETESDSSNQIHSTMDRAHNKLIEQIVESVVSTSSERSSPTLSPEMLSGDNSFSAPILAVEDPLGAFGLDAFASRDKIRHSPLEKSDSFSQQNDQPEPVESSCGSSNDGSTLVVPTSQTVVEEFMQSDANHGAPEVDTAMLIDLGNSSPPSSDISDITSKHRSELNPDFAAWNATLQRASSSSSMNPARSPARPALDGFDVDGAVMTNEDLEGAIVVEDLLAFVETEKSERNKPSAGRAMTGFKEEELLLNESSGRQDDSPFASENVSTHSEEGISLWHLDDRLPDRLSKKIESDDESPRLSDGIGSSSSTRVMASQREATPRSGSTLGQSGLIPEARKLDLTSSVEEDNLVTDRLTNKKSRYKSGSSQKSVTFLDPFDEQNDESRSELIERTTESISEETMPVIEDEWFTSPSDGNNSLRADSPVLSSQRVEASILGEEYLISSPKPPLNRTGYNDMVAFSIDLESPENSEDFVFPIPIEDLLEHLSPPLSTSKTPRINRTERVNNRTVSATPDITPELPVKFRPDTVGVDDTPVIKRGNGQKYSLSKRMAALRMTSGSVGLHGSPGHPYSKDSTDFNLLEEDESLLVPTSPVQ